MKVTNQQEKRNTEDLCSPAFCSGAPATQKEQWWNITQIQQVSLGLYMIQIIVLAQPLESLPKGGRTESAI